MTPPASLLPRYDVASYFALAEEGVLDPDERTELLGGMIVAMAPQSPLHAAAVYRVESALRAALPANTVIRAQMPLVATGSSVPEPDVAVLFGSERDYIHRHPGTALLVVEVAVSTVSQDRLTKAAIYSEAGVKNYWIVQPAVGVIDVYSQVRPELRTYARVSRIQVAGKHGATVLVLDGIEDVVVRSQDLFPDLEG